MRSFQPQTISLPREVSWLSRAAGGMFLCCALWLGGCASVPSDKIYDSTPRPRTSQVLVVRGEPDRPYTIIAELNTKSVSSDGGDPIAKLLQKAQGLGADALLLMPPRMVSRMSTSTERSASVSMDDTEVSHAGSGEASHRDTYVLTAWAVAFRKP